MYAFVLSRTDVSFVMLTQPPLLVCAGPSKVVEWPAFIREVLVSLPRPTVLTQIFCSFSELLPGECGTVPL